MISIFFQNISRVLHRNVYGYVVLLALSGILLGYSFAKYITWGRQEIAVSPVSPSDYAVSPESYAQDRQDFIRTVRELSASSSIER